MRKYIFNFIVIIAIVVSGLIYMGSVDRQEKQINPTEVKQANNAIIKNLKTERGWGLGTVDSNGKDLKTSQTTRVSDEYSWALPITKAYVDGKSHELVVVISNDSMQTLDKKALASVIGHEQNSVYNLLTKGSIDGRYEPNNALLTDLGGYAKSKLDDNYQPRVRAVTESGQLIGKSTVPNKITKDDIKIKSTDN